MNKIKHLFYYLGLLLKGNYESGFVAAEKDTRDFETAMLGWHLGTAYTPKHTRLELPLDFYINQGSFNICTWCAATGQKMIEDKVELHVRDLVSQGQRNNLITGNGFASLDSPQKILKNYGISEGQNADIIGDYGNYVSFSMNQPAAAGHKISSYWSVTSRDDRLKILDGGNAITTALDWYTGFNQGGGFTSPWLIKKALGYKIGGHSVLIIGYDLSMKAYIIRNSYGKNWGDNANFYIDMDYLDNHNYGFYANLPISIPIGAFLNSYDGKNVKGSDACIYFIQGGKKKAYPNWASYLAYGGKYTGFVQLTSAADLQALASTPVGDAMDIRKSPAWSDISDIQDLDDSNHTLMSTLFNLTKPQVGLTE